MIAMSIASIGPGKANAAGGDNGWPKIAGFHADFVTWDCESCAWGLQDGAVPRILRRRSIPV